MDLATKIEEQRGFGEHICQQLKLCMDKIGFSTEVLTTYPSYQTARFELIHDPLTGDFNLAGYWYDAHKQRIGRLQFQSDGSCYAEFDVVQNHPTKPQWFVEKVLAWGKMDNLKTEPSLLRLPE